MRLRGTKTARPRSVIFEVDPAVMNVVEKEDLYSNGSEADISGVVRHRAQAPVLGMRERRALTGHEVRRLVSERSEDLRKFIAPLEEHLRKALRLRTRSNRHTPRALSKVAELVLFVIRKLTSRETGVYALEPNIPLLLSGLYAGSVEASIISGLVRRAQEALAHVAALERGDGGGVVDYSPQRAAYRGYDIARELDELAMLLKWYVRRKMSAAKLEVSALASALAGSTNGMGLNGSAEMRASSEDEDALFGFEVVHDQFVFGTKGCFISCGLKLVGHDGQSLWLRVSVLHEGRPLCVRSEWSSWSDPGGSDFIEVVPDSAPFCSLVPIRPQAQRLIIDEIRAFVPYGALDVASGRVDVELCISVLDSDGKEILNAVRPDSICIPRREVITAPVPAPHSVGMWPHDVVSGDRISDLKVSADYKSVGGWERHTVSVQFDLALFMHTGESVLLEARFLNEAGEVVELSSLGIPYVASDLDVAVESVSSYRYRRVLHPRGAWAHYRNLCIDIPVEFLLLSPGSHRLTCEVVIVSSDDRVLCGDMRSVVVVVPREIEGQREEIVALESVEINPAWRSSGVESVRVQAIFTPTNTSRHIAELAAGRVGELCSPYRVEISIEREDGHVLLQAFSDSLGIGFKPVTRSVCIDGHTGSAHQHKVVSTFPKEEILAWSFGADSQRALSKLRLFARVRALSLSGEVLVSHTKEFFAKPVGSGGRRVVELSAPLPQIVDVEASLYAQTSLVSCRALVNMPFEWAAEEGVVVSGIVVFADGQRREIVNRRIGSHRASPWISKRLGLSQIPIECEYALSAAEGSPTHVEISLRSARDEQLHCVNCGVAVTGVLADVVDEEGLDRSREHFDHAGSNGAAESLSTSDGGDAEARKAGIFGWIWR